MKALEGQEDDQLPTGVPLVARLDGRGFSRLTQERLELEKPFDLEFYEAMSATGIHLMTGSGFKVGFGYIQSDEISLLFGPEENAFARSRRKWTSILAGEASAFFSLQCHTVAAFDCRVMAIPEDLVGDYFRWRRLDARRNALNGWCYWTLRHAGQTAKQATQALSKLSTAKKVDLLRSHGIEFEDQPDWQKHGICLVWKQVEAHGVNPVTGELGVGTRRRIERIADLTPEADLEAALRPQI